MLCRNHGSLQRDLLLLHRLIESTLLVRSAFLGTRRISWHLQLHFCHHGTPHTPKEPWLFNEHHHASDWTSELRVYSLYSNVGAADSALRNFGPGSGMLPLDLLGV